MINNSSHTINTQKSYIFEHIPTDYFINTHAHIKKKCKLYLSKQIKKPYVNYTLKKKKLWLLHKASLYQRYIRSTRIL